MKYLLLIIMTAFFLLSCGENLEEKATGQIEAGNYIQAANTYKKLAAEQPEKADYFSSLAAVNQLRNGQKIYDRNKIKSKTSAMPPYIFNYDKALNLLPDEFDIPSGPELSTALMNFAKAIYDTEAPNSVKETEWEELMMEAVDYAEMVDPENALVQEFQDEVFTQKFAEAKAKGDEYYNIARNKRSDYDYLLAEKQYKYALKFMPDDEETIKQISKVRTKTLGMWDPGYGFIYAVSQTKSIKEHLWLVISLKNNTDLPMSFDPTNFTLFTKNGDELSYDAKMSAEDKNSFKKLVLKPLAEKDGIIAFKFSGKLIELEKIEYIMDSGDEVSKYFP